MRAAPSASSSWPCAVSAHRTRRPARWAMIQPSAASLARAWRADFSPSPRPPATWSRVEVHGGSPAGSTNSPRTVSSSERALPDPPSGRRAGEGTPRPGSSAAGGGMTCCILGLLLGVADTGRAAYSILQVIDGALNVCRGYVHRVPRGRMGPAMPVESFNASVYLLDRQVEAGRGGHLAVAGPAGSLTYAELAQRVAAFASGLQALGVRPEERVVLVTSDRPETVITFLALLRMGAVAVPVSTMYNGAELGELLRDTRARVVVATSEFAAVTREAMSLAPEAGTLVLAGEDGADGGGGPGARSWADVLAEGQRAGPAAPYGTWFDSPGFWLYTSGTTGTPKAAMHRHGSIARVCETYAQQVLGITPEDRCYSLAKLFFAYGIGNSLFFPFSVGATAVLDPARATPAGAVARLAEDRPSLFFAGPAFFAALLAAETPAGAF